MENEVTDILQKTASYVGETQTVLDKHAENRVVFVKRANQVAGVLANKGILRRDQLNAFVDKVAEDESGSAIWDFVEKLADAIPADTLGGAAEEKLASVADLDPFEKLALHGDPRADGRESGMID